PKIQFKGDSLGLSWKDCTHTIGDDDESENCLKINYSDEEIGEEIAFVFNATQAYESVALQIELKSMGNNKMYNMFYLSVNGEAVTVSKKLVVDASVYASYEVGNIALKQGENKIVLQLNHGGFCLAGISLGS
ncbi:MAG: hypothetical protein J6Z36_01320, partial [Clostridia bacterium]|nr:hypothetical protein [Clostridia bacterium]